jgi:CRP-like cAMP-binding protein
MQNTHAETMTENAPTQTAASFDEATHAEKFDRDASGDATADLTRDLTMNERIEALRRVHVFNDLPDEQLHWFAANSHERRLQVGEILFRKGDAPDQMTVYLAGEIEARRDENSLDGMVYIARAGDPTTEVSGMLPFSRMTEYPSTSRATAPSRLLLFPVALFPEMLQRMPLLAERLVWLLSDRVRESTKQDQQRDKLMALGKLSAGLAHELNNPAAAARRAAKDLRDALGHLRESNESFCRQDFTPEARERITAFEHTLIERAATSEPLDSMTRSDREDDITTWLDARDINECWAIAPVLVEANATTDELAELETEIGAAAVANVIGHVVAQLSAAKLTSEIETSTTRISELVGAIKEYSYMDRAAVQEVDLHKGLESTLVILNHKIKKAAYASRATTLPTCHALPSTAANSTRSGRTC